MVSRRPGPHLESGTTKPAPGSPSPMPGSCSPRALDRARSSPERRGGPCGCPHPRRPRSLGDVSSSMPPSAPPIRGSEVADRPGGWTALRWGLTPGSYQVTARPVGPSSTIAHPDRQIESKARGQSQRESGPGPRSPRASSQSRSDCLRMSGFLRSPIITSIRRSVHRGDYWW